MKRPDRYSLPAALQPLVRLAGNLRWSWHEPTRLLFRRIDADLWHRTGHDAWRLLQQVPAERLERLASDGAFLDELDTAARDLDRYLTAQDTWFSREHADARLRIAYFSAEFGLVAGLRIYSGGLGVLAGDHLKSASDLGVPLVGVGLFYREGYFTQRIDGTGRQQDVYEPADPGLLPLDAVIDEDGQPLEITVPVAERTVTARAWHAHVGRVPLYLLDTDVAANEPEDRRITDRLYGGDEMHRLQQELVLGVGGVRLLRALAFENPVIHMNEGHAAFAALERAREHMATLPANVSRGHTALAEALLRSSRSMVFTTHTPVEAGHDYFSPDLMREQLGPWLWKAGIPLVDLLSAGRRNQSDASERFCMTILAIHGASRRNAVSELHGQVSRNMWSDIWPDRDEDQVPIHAITNGVHLATWVAPAIADLFTKHVGDDWPDVLDDFHWRRIDDIPDDVLWHARQTQREHLVDVVRHRIFAGRGRTRSVYGDDLDPDALTIVFARRFAAYKRATLLLSEPERLAALVRAAARPVQFIFAGKAHPRDELGKSLLRQIVAATELPELAGRFIFLEEYDVELARALVQGADVWLNVPLRPREASGTSGMKAAANGALNISILDGWWAEAWTDHNRLHAPIGWKVDAGEVEGLDANRADAAALFRVLENEAVPLFHQRDGAGRPAEWLRRVRAALRQLPPFFSTHRMVRQYVTDSYLATGSRFEVQRATGESVSSR